MTLQHVMHSFSSNNFILYFGTITAYIICIYLFVWYSIMCLVYTYMFVEHFSP